MRRRHRHPLIALPLAGLLAGLLVGPASAGMPFALGITVLGECATATGPGSTAGADQLDAAGAVIQHTTANTVFGNYSLCFNEPFVPGMKLRVTIGSDTRTLTVPTLSMKINRQTDVVSGLAPKSVALQVQVTDANMNGSGLLKTRSITSTATGTYSTDMTSLVNMIGGDSVRLMYKTAAGDVFWLATATPQLVVMTGSSRIGANLPAGMTTSVKLTTSTGVARGATVLSSAAERTLTTGMLVSAAGVAVTARVGDKVSASFAADTAMTIKAQTLAADVATKVVSGICPAGRPLLVTIWRDALYAQFSGACAGDGTWAVNVTSYGLQADDKVVLDTRTGAGDIVRTTLVLP